MLKSAASKVMWVGRATVFLVGLAVILALVFGAASSALSATGGNFILGKANSADRPTTLSGTLSRAAQSALVVVNKGAGVALDLRVTNPESPPMKVNSDKVVAKLNADKVDGQDASTFAAAAHSHDGRYYTKTQSDDNYLAKTAKAADSAKLDGKDASAFGIKTNHNHSYTDECDTPNVWNECAKVEVTVPAGETYLVSVWSSFTAKGGVSNQNVRFCSAKKDPGQTGPSCITPFGIQSAVTVPANQFGSAAASGETHSLSEGTYVFSTAILPTAEFAFDNFGIAITKVLVRDASGATVTSASVSKVAPSSRER